MCLSSVLIHFVIDQDEDGEGDEDEEDEEEDEAPAKDDKKKKNKGGPAGNANSGEKPPECKQN